MDVDSESTATSIDENTENFCDNPTRDTLAEGLMGLIKPTVDQLDERVRATRISQLELKQCIETLCEELKKISDSQQSTVDLDNYVKKLINAKQRVTVLSNILQNVQDRLNRVHASIEKETVKRKIILNNTIEDQNALEHEMEFLRRLQPKFAVEIGSGSGIVVTALTSVVNDCVYFATDVNPDACDATVETAELNGAAVSCVQMNLLSNFRDKFFDVVLFNPPYVVTDPSETVGRGLNRAWAGGLQGRQITNQVLHNLNTSLSEKGVCYMVLLKENNIDEIASLMCKNKFRTEIVIERKIRGEHLYVAKFSRIS
ncbi:hypothetical protein GEV33_009205 [Tenebrio molitor]|uniref:Methyltransferase HEMK2 n=1 Tax=Tenebrio molitor TaxID=7067 RepID=A0A8J6HFB3_TENMO|nr:hypothetical protein GEV33_009205 [Tenebrio molitor]